jgi:hypothetical protein
MKIGDLVLYRGRFSRYQGQIGIIMKVQDRPSRASPGTHLAKVLFPARSPEPIQINKKHLELVNENR